MDAAYVCLASSKATQYILRRVKCFVREMLQRSDDLVIGTVLLSKLNKIVFADREMDLAEYLVDKSKINVHLCITFLLQICCTQIVRCLMTSMTM